MSRKGDVVEVALPGDAAPPQEPVPSALPESGSERPSAPPARRTSEIVARVTRTTAPGVCPAPCEEGDEYIFDATVPAGICINAAHTLLPTVLALRHVPPSDHDRDVSPMIVRCSRADCNSVFEVRRQP